MKNWKKQQHVLCVVCVCLFGSLGVWLRIRRIVLLVRMQKPTKTTPPFLEVHINSTVKERAERLWRGMYAAERFNNSPTCRGGENKQKTPIPFDEGGGYNFILGNVGYWSKELSVLFLLAVRMSVTLSGCQSVIQPSRLRMSKKIISFRESTSDYDKLFSRAL